MPRSGDTYILPANSKGSPSTVIQSSKYNAVLDDLAADANTPRPVVAGGTGATNATSARVNLGTNNANNIDTGTLNDARLPSTMATKTFTDKIIVRGFAPIVEWRETDVAGTAAWYGVMDSVGLSFRYQDLGSIFLDMQPTGIFRWLGNTIWHQGNDGIGSGLDADTWRGQVPSAFVQNNGATYNISITGAAQSAVTAQSANFATASQDAGSAAALKNGGSGSNMVFNYAGQAGTPTYVWGSNTVDGAVNQVYIPANFSVDNAAKLGGVTAASWLKKSELGTELAGIASDEVGTVCMLSKTTAGIAPAGSVIAGSQLTYSNADASSVNGTPSGSWRTHGRAVGGTGAASVTMFRRVS